MGTTHQEIEINAPVDTVWNAIRNFHDMSWAPNVVTSVEWTSSWEQNDEAARDFCQGIYAALLNDMKASLE